VLGRDFNTPGNDMAALQFALSSQGWDDEEYTKDKDLFTLSFPCFT